MPKTEEKRKVRPEKRKKNESLQLLKNVAKSMAGAVPFVDDDTRDTIEDSLARPLSGLASQFMGYNEDTGQVENAAMANLRRIWNSDERRKKGLPPQKRVIPGIVTDTLSLPNMFGNGPEWSQRMQELAGDTEAGVRQSMDLTPPEGFRQHALDSLGVMAGQLPVPGKAKVEAATETGKGALQLLKRYGQEAAMSPIEFFLPTIDPRMSNYLFGAGAGGTLGALGDEVPVEEPKAPHVVARAEGGKIGALQKFLKTVSINPDVRVKQTAHQIGDPVEEVLYATNEGQRRGVLTSEEAKRIKDLLASGEEEQLSEALMELHRRLNPTPVGAPTMQNSPAPYRAPASKNYTEPVNGFGSWDPDAFNQQILGESKKNIPKPDDMTDGQWERIQNRMKDWKVQSVFDLEKIRPTQTTEQLKLSIPSMSKGASSKLDVLKNPRSQEDVVRWAGRDVPEIRFMTDQDGNTYVWDASKAIHNQVLKALGIERKGLFHEMSDTPISPKWFDDYYFSNPWE